MSGYVFPPPAPPSLAVQGDSRRYAVARIFCVGRNYAEHAREMGHEVDREAPFFFTKSALHLRASGGTLAYPPGTADLHHEVELAVALGDVPGAVFGYAAALDMTRRDLQAAAKDKRRPWDTGKDFEGAAIVGEILPATAAGSLGDRRIGLTVNGALRQSARLAEMVWPVEALIAHLVGLYRLGPGDLILTGTPAGVGPVGPGDRLEGWVEGLPPVSVTIGAPARG